MEMVKMGRTWEINSREDYDNAMKVLDGNEFIAMMSDDYYYYRREMDEVARQRRVVNAQAQEKGII